MRANCYCSGRTASVTSSCRRDCRFPTNVAETVDGLFTPPSSRLSEFEKREPIQIEQITGPVTYHGEGPAGRPCRGRLRWVDMLVGDVLTLTADGTVNRRH
jgi:hypothetical protein